MTGYYPTDYLFDADYATKQSYPTRKHWTVGMILGANEIEDEQEEKFMTEHQADNQESSR